MGDLSSQIKEVKSVLVHVGTHTYLTTALAVAIVAINTRTQYELLLFLFCATLGYFLYARARMLRSFGDNIPLVVVILVVLELLALLGPFLGASEIGTRVLALVGAGVAMGTLLGRLVAHRLTSSITIEPMSLQPKRLLFLILTTSLVFLVFALLVLTVSMRGT
ncbi:hypothetical protein K2Y00_03690 [Patescibacteria group bacterium]|nr:hypothetical protein [Patescibacteria group bacterium]